MRRLHYIILGVLLLAAFGTFFVFSQSRTTGNVVECNAPSVLIDGVCCVDSDSDFVCDVPEENVSAENSDVTVAETSEQTYPSFKARLYLLKDVLASESYLPENPEKISSFILSDDKTSLADGKKYYGKHSLYTYLDGVYNEEVDCSIEEYYNDTVLSNRFTVEIPAGQRSQVTNVGYEFVGTPSKVRYDLTCVGFNSKIEWKDSYTYDLVVEN